MIDGAKSVSSARAGLAAAGARTIGWAAAAPPKRHRRTCAGYADRTAGAVHRHRRARGSRRYLDSIFLLGALHRQYARPTTAAAPLSRCGWDRTAAACSVTFPPELPLVGGGGSLVTGARVDSIVPGQVVLELTWSQDLDFVMAPTASGLGLRVRLIGTEPQKGQCPSVARSRRPKAMPSISTSSSTRFAARNRRGGGSQPEDASLRVRDRYRGYALVPVARRAVHDARGSRTRAANRAGHLSARLARGQR